MSSRLSPTLVAGHHVRNSSLVSVGCGQTRLVYAVSPSMLASVDISGDATGIYAIAGKGLVGAPSSSAATGSYASLEHPTQEAISFLCVHPDRDLLCVGTEAHGLYLTRASRPVLTKDTRLPLETTGERTYSGCFLHVPAPATAAGTATPASATAGYAAPLKRNAPPPPAGSSAGAAGKAPTASQQEEDVLVFSSTFKEKKGPNPHRLSLYALKEKCLLWRGAMSPLDCVCAFPLDWSFAACADNKVLLFSVQWSVPSSPDASRDAPNGTKRGHSRSQNNKATLLSRLCSNVDDLRDAEYVRCVTDYYSGRKESSFVALTSNGYMVLFDKETGAVMRWMDCKVCPAHSVQFAGPHVLIVGSMLRFFNTETWEFCGKVKPDIPSSIANSSYLGKLLSSIYTAAVAINSTTVSLYAGSGEAFVYRINKASNSDTPGKSHGASSKKLQIQQLLYYAPIAAAEDRFLWVHPTLVAAPLSPPSPTASGRHGDADKAVVANWCLWSPELIRVYSPRLGLRKALTLDSTCAAYHSPSQVLLAYDANSYEVAAYAAGDDWRGWGRMDQNEQLTCMAASASTDLCAGYSERYNTLTVFSCAWKDQVEGSPRSLLMQRSWVLTLSRPSKAPVKQIFFMGGSKVFAVTSESLVETDTGVEHLLTSAEKPSEVVKACPVGMDVIVLFKDRCAYYMPDSRELKPLSFSFSDEAGVTGDTAVETLLDSQGAGLVDQAYEPVCDLVAVCDAHRVVVARLIDNAVVAAVEHDARASRSDFDGEASESEHDVLKPIAHREIKSINLRAGPVNVFLTVIDSMGHVTEYTLEDRRIEMNTISSRGASPRGGKRPTTPLSRSATARRTNSRAAVGPSRPAPAPNRASARAPAGSAAAGETQPARTPLVRGRGRPEATKRATAKTRARTVAAEGERKPRMRAVSAQAPSNRELADRLEALSGYYEQQKVNAQHGPARTPRRGSALNTVRESTPEHQRRTASEPDLSPDAAPSYDVVDHVDVGPINAEDSPPPARTRTAKRGVAFQAPGPEAAAGAGEDTSMAVSALTAPSWTAEDGGHGLQRQDQAEMEAGQPQPCDRSPMRKGDLPAESFIPYAEDEVVVRSSPKHPSAGPPARSDGASSCEGGVTTRLAALKESLLHLKDMLEQGRDGAADLAGSAEAERELNELPSLLSTVAEALRERNERHSYSSHVSPASRRDANATVVKNSSDSHANPSLGEPRNADAGDATSYQVLMAELQRIRKQNSRLEEQNRAIMDRLEPNPKREY